MFGKLFNKIGAASSEEVIVAPITGKVLDITEVPDPVFSQKMMGEGVAIIPQEGIVISPVEGKVIKVFESKHAIAIESKKGIQIMIHIGLETVNLGGEGFKLYVEDNQKIKLGDKLMEFDMEYIKSKNLNLISPIIIINTDEKVNSLEKLIEIDCIRENTNLLKIKTK